MKEKLRRLQERQEGAILLEASIAIITFLMFVLMLYGILVLFLAQNLVGHASPARRAPVMSPVRF